MAKEITCQQAKDDEVVAEPELTEEELLEQAKDNLAVTLRRGSEALFGGRFHYAINLYNMCFTQLQQHTSLGQSTDIILLRFARGVAYVSNEPNEDLVRGIKELDHLLKENHISNIKYLILYYLSKAYIRQHRYTEAYNIINECYSLIEHVHNEVINWPGSTLAILESDKLTLSASLQRVVQLCRYPPKPDFKCSSDTCLSYGHYNNAIYKTAPDFNGYVSEYCTEKCVLYYHPNCWKKHKSHDKQHSKDVIDTPCPTPDCGGFIYKYLVYDDQANRRDEVKSKKYPIKNDQTQPKKVLKTKPISAARIEKLEERKRNRREKRAQLNTPDEKEENQAKDESEKTTAASNVLSPQPDIRAEPIIVKQKKKDDDNEQVRTTRKHTKKVRQKPQIWNPFVEPDTSYDPDRPFAVPSDLQYELERFDREYNAEVEQDHSYDDPLERSVREFYYDFLRNNGPMPADSPDLLGIVESEPTVKQLIESYGGLEQFLLNSPKFAHHYGYIYLCEDYVRSIQLIDCAVGILPDQPISSGAGFGPTSTLSPFAQPFQFRPANEPLELADYLSSAKDLYDLHSSSSSLASSNSKISSHLKVNTPRIEDEESLSTNVYKRDTESFGEISLDSEDKAIMAVYTESVVPPQSQDNMIGHNVSSQYQPDREPSQPVLVDSPFQHMFAGLQLFNLPLAQSTDLPAPDLSSQANSSNQVIFDQGQGDFDQIPNRKQQTTDSITPNRTSVEVQTDVIEKHDKEISTDYEKKDDYDKKVEECEMLKQRNNELQDKLKKLANSSSVRIQELEEKYTAAAKSEKTAIQELEKLKRKSEKEARKLMDEKKAINEREEASKKLCTDARKEVEQKNLIIKQLEESLAASRKQQQTEISDLEMKAKQYQAAKKSQEQRAMKTEVELLKLKEAMVVSEVDHLLSSVVSNIQTLEAHRSRPDVYLTDHNQLAQAQELKSQLTEIKNSINIKYRIQRERIETGAAALSDLPTIISPNIQDLNKAYTTIFRISPMQKSFNVNVRPMSAATMVGVNHGLGMSGAAVQRPYSPVHNSTMVPQQRPLNFNNIQQRPQLQQSIQTSSQLYAAQSTQSAADNAGSRKAAAERQLIDEILEIFPQKTEEDIRNYIKIVRQRKTKLTGMRLKDLKQYIVDIIQEDS